MSNNPSALPQPNVTYFDIYDEDDTFLMRTTMSVMARVLDFHRDGPQNRILQETGEPGGMCKIHFNNKHNPIGRGRFVMVQLALGPRSNY